MLISLDNRRARGARDQKDDGSILAGDVAAGWLIAREAGASVADFRGNEIDLEKPFFCAAATAELLQQATPHLNV